MSFDDFTFNDNYDDIVVPKRFSDRIVSHVVSHYLENASFFRPPLYLVIEGSPGEGKTIQTMASCKKRGIEIFYISGSRLAGKNEGDSKQILNECYQMASKCIDTYGMYVTIMIDDFHLSNAINDETVTRTINSNILINYMMNLSASSSVKIPIILTGNDFSKIYAPLIRDGRADIFKWKPTEEEKRMIARQILQPLIREIDHTKLDPFIDEHLNESVAFFSQLRHDYRLNIMLELISGISNLNRSTIKTLGLEINRRSSRITIDMLEKFADQRMSARG